MYLDIDITDDAIDIFNEISSEKINRSSMGLETLKDRSYIEGKIPKTGRSFTNYSVQLFPDIETSKLLSYLKVKLLLIILKY